MLEIRCRQSGCLDILYWEIQSSMKPNDALRELAGATAFQWGRVTVAQAGALGVARLTLARLADSGHLERVGSSLLRSVLCRCSMYPLVSLFGL